MMVVTEAFKFPRLTSNNVTMISEKRVSAPTGLKVRFKPFGSGKSETEMCWRREFSLTL